YQRPRRFLEKQVLLGSGRARLRKRGGGIAKIPAHAVNSLRDRTGKPTHRAAGTIRDDEQDRWRLLFCLSPKLFRARVGYRGGFVGRLCLRFVTFFLAGLGGVLQVVREGNAKRWVVRSEEGGALKPFSAQPVLPRRHVQQTGPHREKDALLRQGLR